jgi:hypothetical protein
MNTLPKTPENPSLRGGGPKSLNGKTRSRLNGVKHGLRAVDDIFVASLNLSEQAAFTSIRRMLVRFYHPETSLERLLVDRMAIQHLRQLRLYHLEAVAMDFLPVNKGSDRSVFPHLDRFSQYDVRIEKQLRILHNRLISVCDQNASNCLKPFSNLE